MDSEQFVEDLADDPGRALPWPGPAVAHPCNCAGRVRVDDHVLERGLPLIPFHRGLDGIHLGVECHLSVAEGSGSLRDGQAGALVVCGD